jgi:hypothetical protein
MLTNKTIFMRKFLFFFYMFLSIGAVAQVDSAADKLLKELDDKPVAAPTKKPAVVFLSQRLINANTVEMLKKGYLEFKVIHDFGDIGGVNGGPKAAYGLDGATDIKIGFTVGVTKNFNVSVARIKGGSIVQQLFEMGFKYRFMEQMEKDPSHPLSITAYANGVLSSQKANTAPDKENSYSKFSDRQSQLVQLMIARKFGNILSFQLSPTYVHTNYVVPGDVPNIFALGAALRVPIYKKFVFIADYFHAFRSQASIDALKPGTRFYDALGVGLELVTPGHIFHVNFTNATNILENRFIPRTFTSWDKGQYRWGFTIARNFILFRDKKKK